VNRRIGVGGRDFGFFEPLRVFGGLDDDKLGRIVLGLGEEDQLVAREVLVRAVAVSDPRLAVPLRTIERRIRDGLIGRFEVEEIREAVIARPDLLDICRLPARRPDPNIPLTVTVAIEQLGIVGICQVRDVHYPEFVMIQFA